MLCRNDIVRIKATGQRMRLIAVYPETDAAWIFDLDAHKPLPEYRPLSTLHAQERAGDIELVQGRLATGEVRPSQKATDRAQLAWERIKPLVNDPQLFDPASRSQMIRERADAMGCTMNTLYAHLRRYWAGGQTTRALLGHFHLAGRRGSGETANRGAKPTLRDRDIYQLKRNDIENIEAAIRKHYLGKDTASLPAARQRLREEHYSFLDGNEQRILKPEGECPSLRQVRRILKQKFKLEVVIRKRTSDTEFERDHRPTLSSAVANCLGVGHVYEIDATVMDVFIVAKKSRARIIGKPTLYLIYDRKSRLIVGFSITLENPSWLAAMQAILSIAEDKAALCARYGVKYDPADWPAHGLFPREFVGDRGEMLSKDSNSIVSGLELTVANCPRERPDFKGTVECGFKLIQTSMADVLPGYEPPQNFRKRRGKHYEKDASLTLDELISTVLANIVAHNRQPMPGYPLSPEMLCDEVQPIPLQLWAHDQARRSGTLTRFDEEYVRFSLLPTERATITRDGIRFGDCYYSCPEAVRDGWFVQAGRGVFHIPISFDRRLVDVIYLHDPSDRAKYLAATLLMDKSGQYKGLSFAEVKFYETLAATQRAAMPDQKAQVRSDFHAHVDPISEHAKQETRRVTKGVSRSARKADTKVDRVEERRERRQTDARMPGTRGTSQPQSANVVPFAPTNPSSAPAPAQSSDSAAPLTLAQRLAAKRKEMLNG